MSIEKLGRHLGAVEDPRCSGKVGRRLVEALVAAACAVAACAVAACAGGWDGIALHGRGKLLWLRTFLEPANGIPWHDTFRRVFMLTGPGAFEAGFAKRVGSLVAGFKREVAATDGKAVRRLFDHGRERSALHVAGALVGFAGVPARDRFAKAGEQGLAPGRRCVDGPSNSPKPLGLRLRSRPSPSCWTRLRRTLRVSTGSPRRCWRAGGCLLALQGAPPGARGCGGALRPALLPPRRIPPGRLRRVRWRARPPGPAPGVRQRRCGEPRRPERLAGPARRARG